MSREHLIQQILRRYGLCSSCLGRQLSDPGLKKVAEAKGAEYGRRTGTALGVKCYICGGLMQKLEPFADKVLQTLREYDFETFLVGASLPAPFMEREDEVRARFKLKGGESVKSELTRRIGATLAAKTGKKVRYRDPDLVILVKPTSDTVKVTSRPAYIFGRYVKKVRGLPQKRLKCRECRGRGCSECGFTGRSLAPSVEGILAEKMLSYFKGMDVTFSWIGGEDSKSLVLGRGRPFFAEVRGPKVTRIDGRGLLFKPIDGVALTEIRSVEKPLYNVDFTVDVVAFARFQVGGRGMLSSLRRAFSNADVQVLVKGKKVAKKKVYKLSVSRVSDDMYRFRIICDGGIGIRKLVAGEGGVSPNVPEVLGCQVALDEEKPFDILSVKLRSQGF